MTILSIAQAFSHGKFVQTYPYLTERTEWNVVGESHFVGKESIIKQCDMVGQYFSSVNTVFTTSQLIQEGNKVVVSGTAEFLRGTKRVSFISACDVYVFDEDQKILSITSYCITQK